MIIARILSWVTRAQCVLSGFFDRWAMRWDRRARRQNQEANSWIARLLGVVSGGGE